MQNNDRMKKKRRTKASPLRTRKMNGTVRTKLVCLFGVVMLALVGLGVYVAYINAAYGKQYKQQVLSQSQQKYGNTVIPYQRGDILDCNGTVLATSEKVYKIILDCKVVNTKEEYVEPTIRAMVEVLGLDEAVIREKLTNEKTMSSQYQVMQTNVSITVKKAYEAYLDTSQEGLSEEEKKERSSIPSNGVWFEEDYQRVYPLGSLACDVIGFTYSGNTADWGIEGYYSNTLNGVNGRKYGYYEDGGQAEQNIIEPVNGNTVVSTIDANIQQVVEKYISILMDGLANGPNGSAGAANVGVIVANPNTGEILAMASNNPYDLNNPRDLSDYYSETEIAAMTEEENLKALYALWKNFCLSDAYEPGSTVKPLTVAAALQSGSISADQTYYCDGYQMIGTQKIRCAIYPKEHGLQSLANLIEHSCNDGLMQIAQAMGAETFLKYQKNFNFGSITGIDLPGEAAGLIYSSSQMSDGSTELATSSFGQGFTCTMIQETAAICSVINGGYYYKPHVVSKILDEDGTVVEEIEPVLLKQTVSSDVSALIREYMGTVCQTGYSTKVDGYSMGGKTGTAQKLPRGNGKYLVSFIGFAPLDDPQVVVYTVVDEPNVEKQADSKYAKYLARMILSDILPYMNIFPDEEITGDEDEGMLYFQKKIQEQAEEYRKQKAYKKFEESYEREDAVPGGLNDPAYADEVPEDANDPNLPNPPEGDADTQQNNNRETDGVTNSEAGQ